MSGVTFNRNRVKLKKLLGIRARLALLAVILVAPLMLERAARSRTTAPNRSPRRPKNSSTSPNTPPIPSRE